MPFDASGENEQMRRARRLEEIGRAVVVPEAELTPTRLRIAIAAARALPRLPVEVRLDGAESFARALPGLLGGSA